MNTTHTFESLAKRLRYGPQLDPARDWILLLTFSGVILAGILAWNIWAFHTVARGGTIGESPVAPPPVLDRSSLDTIHGILTSRAVEEAKYASGVYTFSDPSR